MHVITVHGCALGPFYRSSFPCDKRMTVHCCTLRPFYCFFFPCDKRMTVHYCATLRIEAVLLFQLSCDCRMINESGDFVCFCLFLCLLSFVVQVYKRLGKLGLSFPHYSPFPLIITSTLKSICLPPPTLPSRFHTRRTLSGTWYFSNFFFIPVHNFFCLVASLHLLFSQFHSSKKRQDVCY